ncbi:hypothetical protein EON66_09075 [archaeon]|nr:MAG: hypothetical protein EON66_09075 [archaeon]
MLLPTPWPTLWSTTHLHAACGDDGWRAAAAMWWEAVRKGEVSSHVMGGRTMPQLAASALASLPSAWLTVHTV